MNFDLVLEGNIVDPVTGTRYGWVGIEGPYIAEIGNGPYDGEVIRLGQREYILPGFIDPHVHFREPGGEHKEDFYTGTRAAARGGVTTVIDMPNNSIPTVTMERLREKIELSEKGIIDVYFHGGVGIETLDQLEEMSASPRILGFKVYMGHTTGDLILRGEEAEEQAVEALSRLNKPLGFHCEDFEIIEDMERRLGERTDPRVHCATRPRDAEIAALERALGYGKAHGFRYVIHHLSTREGLEMVEQARKRGQDVFCEATPHHLYFTEHAMHDSRLKMNPPLRKQEDVAALRRGLDWIGSDHAPHTVKEKKLEIMAAPAGVPQMDTFGEFVTFAQREFIPDLKKLARVTSYNAAQFYDLDDRARVAEGHLADLTVLNMNSPHRVEGPFETKAGWSPFEGMQFPGKVSYTIYRGEILVEDGNLKV